MESTGFNSYLRECQQFPIPKETPGNYSCGQGVDYRVNLIPRPSSLAHPKELKIFTGSTLRHSDHFGKCTPATNSSEIETRVGHHNLMNNTPKVQSLVQETRESCTSPLLGIEHILLTVTMVSGSTVTVSAHG